MDKYPPELLQKIFALVGPSDIRNLRLICPYWNEVVENITGVEVRLNDTKNGNRIFVESIKLNHLIVERMSSRRLCPKYPNGLLSLTCLRPAGLWFVEEALKLQNLTKLRLVGEFFYLQDLPHHFQPRAFINSCLPSLKFLTLEIPATFQPVTPPMACGVYPLMQGKIAERVAKNIWFILQVIRSPKLRVVEIIDEFPHCITNTIQRYQWWGHVFAGFIHYHQYSLNKLQFKKAFIPYSEDPFTTENIGIPLNLQHLSLSILGADVGNFHYWRSMVQQKHLESLELHLSGSFWKRYSITPFIKLSKSTLRELDLTLAFDSDPLALYPEADIRFDFAAIAACSKLTSLKIGPCGYLAPTTNFSLIPRLLTKLSALYLTFVDISREDLQSITEFENLKTLCLQCLIHAVDDCIYSSVDLSLLKSFLAMRTLDSFAVDLIAVGQSKNPVIEMSTQLFGRRFKGSGFYFPFELEDHMTISSSNLRTPPSNHELEEEPVDGFQLFQQNISDEGGNILPIQEDGGEGLIENQNLNEMMVVQDDFGEPDEAISLPDARYYSVPTRCPCETKARVSRRPDRCVSRFCILAMVDICEDLMRADQLPLWSLYMDGVIPYCCIREFLPNPAPDPVNEDVCCCSVWYDSDIVGDSFLSEEVSNNKTHLHAELNSETLNKYSDTNKFNEVEGIEMETRNTNEIYCRHLDRDAQDDRKNQRTSFANRPDSCSNSNMSETTDQLQPEDPSSDGIFKETNVEVDLLKYEAISYERNQSTTETMVDSGDILTHCQFENLFSTLSLSLDAGIQKELLVNNKGVQKVFEGVDATIQHGTQVSLEDKNIQTDSNTGNFSHVFIQTVIGELEISTPCQCLSGRINQYEASDKAVEITELMSPETGDYSLKPIQQNEIILNSIGKPKSSHPSYHTYSRSRSTQTDAFPYSELELMENLQVKMSLNQERQELPVLAQNEVQEKSVTGNTMECCVFESQSKNATDEKRTHTNFLQEHAGNEVMDKHSFGDVNLVKLWSKRSKKYVASRKCVIL